MKINITNILFFIGLLLLVPKAIWSQDKYVVTNRIDNGFTIAENNSVAPILYSNLDYQGVQKVIVDLQKDIEKTTGNVPTLYTETETVVGMPIIIGTFNKSPLIEQMVKKNLIDKTDLDGKWEKFVTQIVQNPFPGIKKALVIAGSDKRGTMYGIYDLSTQIGVSPWHFWADVPAKKSPQIYVTPGIHTMGEPKVKYRGIFINDEAPALSGWVHENYGSFNAEFYEKVFELILRLKGNYLWPAMWGRMFYIDDPKNKEMADLYGIVMGTSHHEPLTRAHAEWEKFGTGAWDYRTNAQNLDKFWREGIKRMGNTETIVTIGMRGDGDEPMTEGTAIELLENIVKKQRDIIQDVTQKNIQETPQMWALYKEVQEYYDKGMRVPEDVTLLLCDDNWGNIRKLPNLNDDSRSGGYGIYYHFDYVGGPRNYKWINTNQIERTWEQMHLAYQHGVNNVWIVNVGDIKPMEFPVSFFLDYAWNPERINALDLPNYYTNWAESIFGKTYAVEIGNIIKTYTKYNARRKPELLSPETYNLNHYGEAEQIVNTYDSLCIKAEDIYKKIPNEYKDAYYQLVLFPVLASNNINKMYIEVAKNKMYADQGRSLTNETARKVEALFNKDAELTKYFHTKLANGKWNHMMSQTHIGYTYWQEPKQNTIPKTKTISLKEGSDMGISLEGSNKWFPNTQDSLKLPEFLASSNQKHYIEIFNRGKKPFNFTIEAENNWLSFSTRKGNVTDQEKVYVQINSDQIPNGNNRTYFTVQDDNQQTVKILIEINKLDTSSINGFIENDGYIAMDAQNFTRSIDTENSHWVTIPNLGRTASGVTSFPVDSEVEKITNDSPRLEYDFFSFSEGTVKVHAYFSPTLNYNESSGHYYGIGIDNEKPQLVDFHKDDNPQIWNRWVADNVKTITTSHYIKPGQHILKYYMKNSGLVLQKIVIEIEPLKKSYLGPKQSYEIKNTL